jgi:hypothetical protein
VEVKQSHGASIEEAEGRLGVVYQICFRRLKECGDMNATKARKLKDPEKENLRLKKLVTDL